MCGNSVTINSIDPLTVVTQHGLNQLPQDKIMWPAYGNDIHKNTGQITVITILILPHLISLPTRKIGTPCIDVGSALKNDVVQAGLVFDVVLFLPSISRSRCLIDTNFADTFKTQIPHG